MGEKQMGQPGYGGSPMGLDGADFSLVVVGQSRLGHRFKLANLAPCLSTSVFLIDWLWLLLSAVARMRAICLSGKRTLQNFVQH